MGNPGILTPSVGLRRLHGAQSTPTHRLRPCLLTLDVGAETRPTGGRDTGLPHAVCQPSDASLHAPYEVAQGHLVVMAQALAADTLEEESARRVTVRCCQVRLHVGCFKDLSLLDACIKSLLSVGLVRVQQGCCLGFLADKVSRGPQGGCPIGDRKIAGPFA